MSWLFGRLIFFADKEQLCEGYGTRPGFRIVRARAVKIEN